MAAKKKAKKAKKAPAKKAKKKVVQAPKEDEEDEKPQMTEAEKQQQREKAVLYLRHRLNEIYQRHTGQPLETIETQEAKHGDPRARRVGEHPSSRSLRNGARPTAARRRGSP